MAITPLTASALAPGQSAVFQMPTAAWTSYTVSWTCSDATDAGAHVTVEGSADGATFFPLRNWDAVSTSQTGTGAQHFQFRPVIALKVTVACSEGNTVSVSAAGN